MKKGEKIRNVLLILILFATLSHTLSVSAADNDIIVKKNDKLVPYEPPDSLPAPPVDFIPASDLSQLWQIAKIGEGKYETLRKVKIKFSFPWLTIYLNQYFDNWYYDNGWHSTPRLSQNATTDAIVAAVIFLLIFILLFSILIQYYKDKKIRFKGREHLLHFREITYYFVPIILFVVLNHLLAYFLLEKWVAVIG